MPDNPSLTERGISVATLREILEYDPVWGRFTWKCRNENLIADEAARNGWNGRHAGRRAFTASLNGYKRASIQNKRFFAHRVAWAMYHGEWPSGQIDHINGDRSDNRIQNLRVVDTAENARNTKRFRTNTSGVTGVHWASKARRWCARIMVNQVSLDCGSYVNFEDAVAARKEAEKQYGFHPNHGRDEAGEHYALAGER